MDREQLINVMMTKGHSRSTAEGAIAGRGIESLWNEYMGGSSGPSSSGRVGASRDEIQRVVSQYDPTKVAYQPFEDAALKELAPYYQTLLDQEGGDVDRAKKRMEEDYSRGVRYSTEDLERGRVQRTEDLGSFQKYEESQFPKEELMTKEALNSRGILNSGIATDELGRLRLGQEKRKEAVTRALQRQEDEQRVGHERTLEAQSTTKSRGLEDVSTQFSRYQKELEQTKRKEAVGLGAERFNRAVSMKQFEQQQALQPFIYGS